MKKEIPLLKLKNVSKFYYNKGTIASGFSKVSLEFSLGEFVVITGESGSGKSTLLNVLSGLDTYEEGEMYINGEETSHYGESDFEKYRKTYIGNIFQSFNLVNSYTVYQNIELVLLLNGYKKKDIKEKILKLIKDVDLYRYRNSKVSHLSGGQKQRVAIARALAKDTPIIIADEPTGNLDSKSAANVLRILSEVAKDKLVILVTHNYPDVEKYATRKIEMHDGKVREDITLKEVNTLEPVIKEYLNLNLFNKVRLGIRNTFNIIPKFILMFIVFIFIILSFLGTYSGFRNSEHEQLSFISNGFFTNSSSKRIVLNKKNKSAFSESDLTYLKNIEHVEKVVEDDLLTDTSFVVESNNYSFYGYFKNVEEIDSVDVGRLPESINEIVICGSNYDYYIAELKDEILDEKYIISNDYGEIKSDLTVVGIIYEDSYDYNYYYFATDDLLDIVRKNININYSTQSVKLNDVVYDDGMIVIKPSNIVPTGKAYADYKLNDYCKYNWCIGKNISISVENTYYKENIELEISNIFSNYTYKNLGFTSYDEYSNVVYISNSDYDLLFNKATYQVGLYVDDDRNVDDIIEILKNDYNTLALKDANYDETKEFKAIISVIEVVVIVILFVVLFFVSYFVIRLIQKSKNVYYATVRILGGSMQNISDLIKIELLTIFNLTYVLVVGFVYLNNNYFGINYFKNLSSFLSLKDYILIYVIVLIMSLLISVRYSRKLFGASAMKTYNEEV